MNRITEKWERKEDPAVVLRVREAQVRQLYEQARTGLAGTTLIMISACYTLWEVIPHRRLLLWSGALGLLTAIRVFHLAVFYRKKPSGPGIYLWARLQVAAVIASGVMWALPSIFLWPHDFLLHQLVWPICIVALSASAVAQYCTWKPAYISFLVLTMVPISVRLLAEGGLVYDILGFLGFVFTIILGHTGNLMHNANLRALVMGIHNEALSRFLSVEKAREEVLNDKLQEEIGRRTRSQEELRLRNEELEVLNAQLTTTKENLEATNKDLERAIMDIKQLSGMLPICASCKKIRNDSGYWEQIEAYLRDHSDVEFSHAICPDCAEKLYPGFYDKNVKDLKE